SLPISTSCVVLPADRQLADAVDRTGRSKCQVGLRRRQRQGREPLQKGWERHGHLEPGELLAKALMDAVSECQVSLWLSSYVQHVRVDHEFRITVDRWQRHHSHGAGP